MAASPQNEAGKEENKVAFPAAFGSLLSAFWMGPTISTTGELK
jgi:hypothetical protein